MKNRLKVVLLASLALALLLAGWHETKGIATKLDPAARMEIAECEALGWATDWCAESPHNPQVIFIYEEE